jgi:hypothetical protein
VARCRASWTHVARGQEGRGGARRGASRGIRGVRLTTHPVGPISVRPARAVSEAAVELRRTRTPAPVPSRRSIAEQVRQAHHLRDGQAPRVKLVGEGGRW